MSKASSISTSGPLQEAGDSTQWEEREMRGKETGRRAEGRGTKGGREMGRRGREKMKDGEEGN